MAGQTVCVADAVRERAADLLTRIRGEYLEMPGLKLTPAQARRLWGLDMSECEQLLDVLVGSRFLKRSADGAYSRES
jgi:hypothetical protein